jgi:protein disulfide-isomerase A1
LFDFLSKRLEPLFDELALVVGSNKNLLIAKVDATSNEIPGFIISGYPTIKFFKKTKNGMVVKEYEGNRSIKGFLSFLRKESR